MKRNTYNSSEGYTHPNFNKLCNSSCMCIKCYPLNVEIDDDMIKKGIKERYTQQDRKDFMFNVDKNSNKK